MFTEPAMTGLTAIPLQSQSAESVPPATVNDLHAPVVSGIDVAVERTVTSLFAVGTPSDQLSALAQLPSPAAPVHDVATAETTEMVLPWRFTA